MKFNIGALSDLVFEHDSSADQAQPTAAPTKTVPLSSVTSASTVRAVPTSGVTGAADPKQQSDFVTTLRNKLASSPASATISQFFTIAESLSEAIPDEGGRFRAALKTLVKTANVTQPQLSDAFNSMLNLLELEHGKFAKVIETQTAKEVTARQSSITSINDQIEQLSKQRDQLTTELMSQQTQIAGMQTSFELAVGVVSAEVNDSLNKLRIYSPTTTATTATK